MLLEDIKKYIEQKGDASLAELCQKFDIDPEVMRDMLEKLIQKELIRKKQSVEVHCSSCPSCPAQCGNISEIYEWV